METSLAVAAPALQPARQVEPGLAGPGNVVILTVGWTGSSVLAGLLRAAGFWTGETVRNTDYDTFENAELVRLNRKLMSQAGIGEVHGAGFDPEWIRQVARFANRRANGDFGAFVENCGRHAPWVWKDPRLWITIGFWKHLLPCDKVKYLVLTREPLQSWVSCTLRRQIQTFGHLRRYNASVEQSLYRYLAAAAAPHLHIVYEDLLLNPERELARLTQFLGRPVTMTHLLQIHQGKLYRRNHGPEGFIKAALIHLKNYRARLQ